MLSLVVFLLVVASGYGKPQVPVYSYSYSTVVQHGAPLPFASYTLDNQGAVGSHKPVVPPREVDQRDELPFSKNVTKEIEETTPGLETTTDLSESVAASGNGSVENNRDGGVKEKLIQDNSAAEANNPENQGVYYIYHPVNGVLQKVAYSTRNDDKEMALVAQLKYQNVKPIQEPIYTYDPKSFVLQPLKLA